MFQRKSEGTRETRETTINISLNLDGTGTHDITTPDPFLTHLLETIATHAAFDLTLDADGDTEIDTHHTIEDTAITLANALTSALDDTPQIERFADRKAPMDDALAETTLDVSNRAYYTLNGDITHEYINTTPAQMYKHFLRSFCMTANLTVHQSITGENTHHELEALYKSLALALHDATRPSDHYPSTKRKY